MPPLMPPANATSPAPAPTLTLDDARCVIHWADDDETPPARVLAAAQVLLREVDRLGRELERVEARLRFAPAPAARVAGGSLELHEDDGGLRHYLTGEAVHAGTALALLTEIGWLPGRYEWSFRAGDRPRFYTRLPGGDQVGLALDYEARLAWPAELREAR